MKKIRRALKRWLPGSLVSLFRPARELVGDLIGYFIARRRFASNPLAADLSASARAVFRPPKTILTYPDRPRPGHRSAEYRICALLGYAVSADPLRHFDVAFKRKKGAFFDPQILRAIPVSADRIVNARGVDISKENVGVRFAEIFGYDLDVDPTRFHGRIVEKPNENATHLGRVLQGPISPQALRPGYVYQKEIDNTLDNRRTVFEYRVPIHGDQIPLTYIKHRPIETRFASANTSVELVKVRDVFTPIEEQKILLMARRMGIDFGEFDVLRDKDGRMYIIDTNHKPGGPPAALSDSDGKIAFKLMIESFSQLLEKWAL